MPTLRHASMSSVPAGAVSFIPSTVKVTSGIRLLVYSPLAPNKPPTILSGHRLNFRDLNFQPLHDIVIDFTLINFVKLLEVHAYSHRLWQRVSIFSRHFKVC